MPPCSSEESHSQPEVLTHDVQLQNVVYRSPDAQFELVIDDFALKTGEMVALTGPSGSGKSTLLSLISGQLKPQMGSIHVLGQEITTLSRPGLEKFRLQNLGIIFQDFRLLEYLTVAENLALSTFLDSRETAARKADKIRELAHQLHLTSLLHRYPEQLSQGERQRTAIGRALYQQPRIVLADEPTGNLDPKTARETLAFLYEVVTEANASLLCVTHDHSLLADFDRHIDMADLS